MRILIIFMMGLWGCKQEESTNEDTASVGSDCDNITDGLTCVLCLCEETYNVCLDNEECLGLMACISQCSTDDACIETCKDAYPEGEDDFLAFLECSIENCDEF